MTNTVHNMSDKKSSGVCSGADISNHDSPILYNQFITG